MSFSLSKTIPTLFKNRNEYYSNYYSESSIFIKLKEIDCRSSNSSEIDNYISSDGFISSVQLDYETSDDYMKNYKQKYANALNDKPFKSPLKSHSNI